MIVLDASALLAFALKEPGASRVGQVLNASHISTVNASEFIQKVNSRGGKGRQAFEKLTGVGLTSHEATLYDASQAASLHLVSKPYSLSLGDRFCLALAQRLGAEVYTADKAWER